MLSLALVTLLLLASPSFAVSPRAYSARRSKAPRFPSGKYRPLNARFIRRSPMPAGAAGPGQELAGAPVNNITVAPSNVVQCSTATVDWSGAAEPIDLIIGQGGFYVGTTPITTLSSLSGGSTTWLVDQSSGESLIFEVRDAEGAVGYIQNIVVGSSDDGSCLAAASSSATAAESASVTDSSTPTASVTATVDGSDDGGDEDGESGSSTIQVTTSTSVLVTSSSSKNAITTTTPAVVTLSTASPTPTPSPSASGDLGNAALAGALSASASATAKSSSPAVVSVSFLAVVGGMMVAMSFVSL